MTFRAEFGSINVVPGPARPSMSRLRSAGTRRRGAKFDEMLQDFDLQLIQQGSDMEVKGAFRAGWESRVSSNLFD
jgi:hypothetical protein